MSEKVHIIRAEKAFEFKHTVSHPWNQDTIVPGTHLDRMVGLNRARINVIRIPAGGEASEYHAHQCEEEWIYILQGQGVSTLNSTLTVNLVVGDNNFLVMAVDRSGNATTESVVIVQENSCAIIIPGANLSNCDFTGADLSGYDLSETNLSNAIFVGQILQVQT